jgi:hypothetical protein
VRSNFQDICRAEHVLVEEIDLVWDVLAGFGEHGLNGLSEFHLGNHIANPVRRIAKFIVGYKFTRDWRHHIDVIVR